MFMTKKQRLTVKASAGMFVSAFFFRPRWSLLVHWEQTAGATSHGRALR